MQRDLADFIAGIVSRPVLWMQKVSPCQRNGMVPAGQCHALDRRMRHDIFSANFGVDDGKVGPFAPWAKVRSGPSAACGWPYGVRRGSTFFAHGHSDRARDHARVSAIKLRDFAQRHSLHHASASRISEKGNVRQAACAYRLHSRDRRARVAVSSMEDVRC